MSGVARKTLADVCSSVDYGYTAKSTRDPEVGPKYLRITDIVPPFIDWSTVPHCPIEPAKRAKYLLEEGDIVIARSGSVGYAKQIWARPEGATFASYLVRFRPNPALVEPRYLGQIIQSGFFREWVTSVAGGVAQPNANAKLLGSFELHLPPRDVQCRIAAVLGTFEQRLENNQRRIEILEDMARLLYRKWFVHFRFPGHEDIELVESDLGPIPDGWAVSTLANVAEVRRGLSWDREQESDDGVGVLAIPNIGDELDPLPRKFLSGVSEKDLERCAAETGDTLMIGSNGNPERVGQSVWVTGAQQCVVASFLMRIRSCSDLDPYLIFRHVSQGRLVEHLRNGAVGSTGLRNLRVTAVRDAPILRATRELEERFIEVTGPMRRLQDVLLDQNRVLEQARGLLLPRMISGKLDVSDLDLDLDPVA